ncbi:MAG: RrF2 family transcriptional regulator [Fidelibacterota bacterium]
MLLSKASENAIKVIFFLMDHETDRYFRLREIASELNLPYFQTAKLAQVLIRNNILASHTGPRGGVRLIKRPEDLKLIEIVVLMEGENFLDKCILGLSECGSGNPCPVHYVWKDTKAPIIEIFQNKSLADLKEMNFLKRNSDQ